MKFISLSTIIGREEYLEKINNLPHRLHRLKVVPAKLGSSTL